ncbi:MAG: hypothetical protein WA952_01840 [Lewinella sp.]
MTLFDGLAIGCFMLSTLYLVWILKREIRHQRTLGWPRAPAVLADGPDRLPLGYHDNFRTVQYYRAELENPYVFYARGKRYTGHRLAPGLGQISQADAVPFLKQLARYRRYHVVFNPDDPTDNYLTEGKEVMGYLEVLLLSVVGIVLPYIVLFSFTNWENLEGAARILTLFYLPIFALVFYLRSKPPLQLAQRLEVAPDTDSGAEKFELDERLPLSDEAFILRTGAKKKA